MPDTKQMFRVISRCFGFAGVFGAALAFAFFAFAYLGEDCRMGIVPPLGGDGCFAGNAKRLRRAIATPASEHWVFESLEDLEDAYFVG